MADTTTDGQVAGAGTPAATPPTPNPEDQARQRASEERWNKIEQKISALTDTVSAAMTPRQTAPSGNAKPGDIPAHFRNLLRQQGLTDADIDTNAPLIVPFLQAMLATDGAVMLGGIQQVRDEVELVKASRNAKKFPYWNEVEDAVVQMRADAEKNGRYLSVGDAYQAAIASDINSTESRVEAAKARRRAEAASTADDVSSNDLSGRHAGGTPRSGTRRTAMTQEELAALPRAERKKLIEEQFGNTPIR